MHLRLIFFNLSIKRTLKMCSIAAFGNPLLDVIVNTENDNLLKSYNVKPDAQTEISEKDMVNLYSDISKYNRLYNPGGCAQNTLRVMQWILNEPNSTIMFGSVSNDDRGCKLETFVRRDNVKTRYYVHENHHTGTVVALVNKKTNSRTLIANIGAAERYSKSELENDCEALEILKNARVIYIEACFLTKREDTVCFLDNFIVKNNKVLVFNLAATYLFDMVPNTIEHMAKRCHILFGNKNEYNSLGKLLNIPKVEDLGLELNKTFKDYDKSNCLLRYGKIVVITFGAEGIKCIHSDGCFTVAKASNIPRNEIVDTIAAGDSFVAGFMTALLKGFDIDACLNWGQLAAVEIIKQPGCTIPKYPAANIFKDC